MAIVNTDILIKLTTKTGSAGNSLAQADPNLSLGLYISTTQMATTINGLFDNVSGAENAASAVDYRCIAIHNNHATLPYQNAVAYISAEVAGGTTIALASDNTTPTVINSSSAQFASIANTTSTPSGVSSFSSPTTVGTGVALGTIPAGYCKGVWVRRTAANTAALDADGFTLGIAGDSSA